MAEQLPGGQWQRVSIARSLYGAPGTIKIMLLAESPSARDNETPRLLPAARNLYLRCRMPAPTNGWFLGGGVCCLNCVTKTSVASALQNIVSSYLIVCS